MEFNAGKELCEVVELLNCVMRHDWFETPYKNI